MEQKKYICGLLELFAQAIAVSGCLLLFLGCCGLCALCRWNARIYEYCLPFTIIFEIIDVARLTNNTALMVGVVRRFAKQGWWLCVRRRVVTFGHPKFPLLPRRIVV